MKASLIVGAVVSVACLALAGQAASQTCSSSCNTASQQCQAAGKSDTVCLNGWHQCKARCATLATARTSKPPATSVIKASTPARR